MQNRRYQFSYLGIMIEQGNRILKEKKKTHSYLKDNYGATMRLRKGDGTFLI